MVRRACLLGLLLLPAGVTAACRETPASGVGLVMAAPQGVLDDATSLALFVFPADGRECNADGSPSELPDDATTFELSKGNCASGATWCGEITLDQGDAAQMFVVQASASAGLLAQGCTTAVIDQDPIEVNIEVVRVVEESCCGDGAIQADEQCDNGGSDSCGGTTENAACASDCSTRLVWLDDRGTNDPEGEGQAHLAITFAPGDGQLDGGLRAAWDFSTSLEDLAIRTLQPDLSPITDPEGLDVAYRVYLRCSLDEVVPIRQQTRASLTPFGSGAVVAYLTEEYAPLRFDAVAYTLNSKGCSDQLTAIPMSDQNTSVDAVDIATGPSSAALVVWEQDGRIYGRTFDGDEAGSETITISDAGSAPRVAGSSEGWVVVYQGPQDTVLMQRVSTGLDVAPAVRVNEAASGVQDQPDVATTNDGSAAVVFRNGGDVYLQRFSASDEPTAEDATAPIHASADGEQAAPAIQAGGSGDFFIVAWQSDNGIRARFAGRSAGFLFNNVTGQNEDFEASMGAGSALAPAVAAGDFVAIGWIDQAGPIPGVVVRRFPLPKP